MAVSQNGELKVIPLADIRENVASLRPVDKGTEAYLQFVDSIKQMGILNPPSVREMKDPSSGKIFYAITDGLHRTEGARDAGLKEIPCYVRSLTESEVWEAQVVGNVHKIETKFHDYAGALNRILIANPLLTVSELAAKVNKSPAWISKVLKVVNITNPSIQEMINSGKINAANATQLATLPIEGNEQNNFVDRAMTMNTGDFAKLVQIRVKEIRDAKRQGRAPKPEEFVALPRLRKMKELKDELDSTKIGVAMINQFNLKTALDAWKMAMKYVLMLDPKAVEERKAKEEERVRLKKEADQKKKVEKAQQRAKEAAEKAAALTQGK